MTFKIGVLAGLLCVALFGAGAWSPTVAGADDAAEGRQLISEGLGVKSVFLWRSTMDDVVAAYGSDYTLVEHGTHSFEIRYAQAGLSFYYCREDPRKRIFDIECRAPFDGFTAKGIVLGQSTLRDVFKAYGPAEQHTTSASETWFYEYPGIDFHVAYKDVRDQSRLLGSKIIAIDIVTSRSGSDCLPANLN